MRYVDDVLAQNVYPSYPGPSLGQAATTTNASSPGADVAQEAAQEVASQPRGNPLAFWVMFVILLLGLMVLAQRLGASDEFSNIKGTAYNVLVVALIAIVGIPPIKLAVNKLPAPQALRDYVNAV